MSRTAFMLRGRTPDVLSCIANLSSDEAFRQPGFADGMLDTPAYEAWAADIGKGSTRVVKPPLEPGPKSFP